MTDTDTKRTKRPSVLSLQRCPCYSVRECVTFSIFKTKTTIQVIVVYKRTGLTTAISRKVVAKSVRDNPERCCGWFWVDCSSNKFKRMAREAGTDICLRMLQESKKSRFDSYSVRKSELVISDIIFRDCRLHIFPTTLLEIAVYLTDTQQVLPGSSANVIKRNWIDAATDNRLNNLVPRVRAGRREPWERGCRLNPHEHTSRLNCKYPMLRVLYF